MLSVDTALVLITGFPLFRNDKFKFFPVFKKGNFAGIFSLFSK